MSDDDLDRQLGRLGEASAGLRARPGFSERVMLAALASESASFAAELTRALRRVVPVAVLAAALSVLWAVVSEHGTDEVFADADEAVELEW